MVIMFFLLLIPFLFVAYWLGRGVSLNRALAAWEVANDARESGASEDAIVNMRTGEVLEPGTRKYSQAIAKSKVIFE